MLLVLGDDVSARGSELTKTNWVSVLHKFERIMGPPLGLPFQVLLGDRDTGECNGLNAPLVGWIASNLPGLDRAGCAAFEFSNISFVSLNTAALLCRNNDLRFSVDRTVERESLEIQTRVEGAAEAELEEDHDTTSNFAWRKNSVVPGSGPILLLHFPLYRTANEDNSCNCYHNTLSYSLRKGINKYSTRCVWLTFFLLILVAFLICFLGDHPSCIVKLLQ